MWGAGACNAGVVHVVAHSLCTQLATTAADQQLACLLISVLVMDNIRMGCCQDPVVTNKSWQERKSRTKDGALAPFELGV